MRLFVATPLIFPIYSKIKDDLSKYIKGKWVEGWNLHLTHKFIGEDEPEKYKIDLKIPNEKIKIDGLGILGDRILYLKVDSPNIDSINKQINEKFGLKNDKPFKPHITLCRIKDMDKKIFDIINSYQISFDVPYEVYLYKSTLTKKGPIYEKIYRYGSSS